MTAIKTIARLIGSVLLVLLIACTVASAEEYPNCFIVTAIDPLTDTVTLTDCVGFQYLAIGAGDWLVGDCAAGIMDDNGTPETIRDDIIVKLSYIRLDLLKGV